MIESDFLTFRLDEVLAGEPRPLRVAGNLPYNVSSPILFVLLRASEYGRTLSDATLMLDPVRGVLRGVTGEGRTTMTMTIGTATHAFEQRTRVTVQAR